jgi:hypothetical protein
MLISVTGGQEQEDIWSEEKIIRYECGIKNKTVSSPALSCTRLHKGKDMSITSSSVQKYLSKIKNLSERKNFNEN